MLPELQMSESRMAIPLMGTSSEAGDGLKAEGIGSQGQNPESHMHEWKITHAWEKGVPVYSNLVDP